jgi:hypothetical protein
MMDLAFHRLAAVELQVAYGWYAARNPTVASRFLERILLTASISDVFASEDSHTRLSSSTRKVEF